MIADRHGDGHIDADHAHLHFLCKFARKIAIAGEDGNAVAIGHSQYDAPEIDGKVQIDLAQGEAADVGSFVNVEITEAGDYDLFGRLAK